MLTASLFKLLLSDSGLKKTANVFFSIFILFYTVIPLNGFVRSGTGEFADGFFKPNETEIQEEAYKAVIEKGIENICTESEAGLLTIEIDGSMDTDGFFSVRSIYIEVEPKSKALEIQNKIRESLGYEVNIN